jgi:hypothetical protein
MCIRYDCFVFKDSIEVNIFLSSSSMIKYILAGSLSFWPSVIEKGVKQHQGNSKS